MKPAAGCKKRDSKIGENLAKIFSPGSMDGMNRNLVPAMPRARGHSKNSFRNEVVQLHRAIFKKNQKLINQSVLGYTAAFRQYEREYERGVKRF